MYRSMFHNDIFSEMDRLQRALQGVFEGGSSIRGVEGGAFPAVNVVNSPEAIDIYVFAPGLDPARIALTAELGVLTIAGERSQDVGAEQAQRVNVHMNERFTGRFRRVVSLAEDADLDQVAADYRDGILHVNVKRSAAQQPRRIAIQ